MYNKIFRPFLFKFGPEVVHNLTIKVLNLVGSSSFSRWVVQRSFPTDDNDSHAVDAFGLTFSNPVGMAAGYDKDGLAWRGLELLGFGHIEIGTITPKSQYGNPKPRVFRVPEERALINRMGFPGIGAEKVRQNLIKSGIEKSRIIIGINIGKNKDTLNEEAARDYIFLLEKFSDIADYIAINISSPNTIGLRRLQARDYLESLLSQMKESRTGLDKQPPILVKLSPDLKDNELEDAADAILRVGVDGIIATNTTTSRNTLKSSIGIEVGGLSGDPLSGISRKMVATIHTLTGGKIPIIGVGGIMTPDQAKAMLQSGATLIQVYTGLVYGGPAFVNEILKGLENS
jgi:dihydroorotate dehydrogenase